MTVIYETKNTYSAYEISGQVIRPQLISQKDASKIIFVVDREVAKVRNNLFAHHCLAEEYAGLFVFVPKGISSVFCKNRYGNFFSQKEKSDVLAYIRHELECLFGGQVSLVDVPHFFFKKERVRGDLAVWVKGRMRGSVIVEADSLFAFIKKAVSLLVDDMRFKPLSKEELSNSLLEVTFMSLFLLPVSKKNLSDGYFSSSHGVLGVSSLKNTHTGFFVPSVYKVMSFTSFRQMLETLVTQKMKGCRMNDVTFYAYRTEVLREGESVHRGQNDNHEEIRSLLLSYLESNLEEDGFIPFMNNPYSGDGVYVDWARLFYTGSVFAYFKSLGKVDERSEDISSHLYAYLDSVSFRVEDPYALLYVSLLYFYAGEDKKSLVFLERYKSLRNKAFVSIHEDILYLRVCLTVVSSLQEKIVDKVFYHANTFLWSLENETRVVELVSYADIMVCLSLISQKTGSKESEDMLKKVAIKFLSFQHDEGYFAVNSDWSGLPYVRASAKIVEAMLMSDRGLLSEKSLQSFLGWVSSLQIQKGQNDFFIKEDVISKCYGGIMHDDVHAEILLDSVVHVYAVVSLLELPK